MQSRIATKLEEALAPAHLEVIDESHRHNVPPGAESHFKVVVASERFQEMGRLSRHRLVNRLLADAMGGVHALALHALTPEEWFDQAGRTPASPECLGGENTTEKQEID